MTFGADRVDRPVVCGVGMVTPAGLDRAATLEGLRAGRSAVGPIERFDAAAFPWPAAAEVRGFVPRQVLPDRKAIKLMSPPARLAVAAALEAREHAAGADEPPSADGGLWIAAGYETIDLDSVLRMMASCRPAEATPEMAGWNHIDVARLWREARHRMNPLNALKILPNMALAHVAIATGMRGPNAALGPHGASGLLAIGEAAEAVATGEAPFALAGGADSPINIFMVAYFGAEGLLSPSGRCRPFDPAADGTVPGEAAAVLWIEGLRSARSRGVFPLAAVLGHGTAQGHGAYGPPRRPEPWLAAGGRALAAAGVAAGEVQRWTCDGWGVPEVDAAELRAAAALFGGQPPPRRGHKGLVGHAFAAAGALEAALCCAEPADGPELVWAAGVDGGVAALVLGPVPDGDGVTADEEETL